MHIDVSVARTPPKRGWRPLSRLAGEVVTDAEAPATWILADRAGNKVSWSPRGPTGPGPGRLNLLCAASEGPHGYPTPPPARCANPLRINQRGTAPLREGRSSLGGSEDSNPECNAV